MSRRHHGRPHHGRHRNEGPRPDATATRPVAPTPIDAARVEPVAPPPTPSVREPSATSAPIHPPAAAPVQPVFTNGAAGPAATPPVQTNGHEPANGHERSNGAERPNGCTAPQLRRFIKSRPYVPMHELRRRFAIDGTDDDVTQVDLDGGRVYVGLPAREGSLLGELLRGGEIGYELSFDPLAPIVVGVYPMRPVPRT
jgi:hypothetical protein